MFSSKALLLLSLTLLFCLRSSAQSNKICYGRDTLERIAERVIRANECDTLLENANLEIGLQSQIIKSKDNQIAAAEKESLQKENIIAGKQKELDSHKEALGKEQKKVKRLKIMWGISAVLEMAGTIFLFASVK